MNNNKNMSNPLYQKLFPETYAKNVKIQELMSSMSNKLKQEILPNKDIELKTEILD